MVYIYYQGVQKVLNATLRPCFTFCSEASACVEPDSGVEQQYMSVSILEPVDQLTVTYRTAQDNSKTGSKCTGEQYIYVPTI